MSAFSTRLRQLRLRHGLTQTDLASASGLGQSTISALENGRQAPWPSTRSALARAFRLTPESFDLAIAAADPTSEENGSTALVPENGSHAFASAKILDLLEAVGRGEAALARALLEDALAVCPGVESLYAALIGLLKAQGQAAEAADVRRQCEAALLHLHAEAPSAELDAR